MGAPGAGRGAGPTEPPQQQTFERQIAVYVPAGYVSNTPAPFIVVQDGYSYVFALTEQQTVQRRRVETDAHQAAASM